MRALNENERIIKEYDKFVLVEVTCPERKKLQNNNR